MDNWWSMLQVPIKDDKSTPAEVILPEAEDNSKELQHEEPMKKYCNIRLDPELNTYILDDYSNY